MMEYNQEDYPYNVAMIVDNEIVMIFNVDGQMASWYLSNPTFIALSKAKIGMVYKDGDFINPEK
jgi:hypothetical protein